MLSIVQELEREQIREQSQNKKIPDFRIGDTVVVKLKVKEGERERLQSYEGVVIAKRNRGVNSAFTVRKISHGEGVERVFQTYSNQVHSIEIKRRGNVRRGKLYYLRDLSGRKARIQEKIASNLKAAVAPKAEEVIEVVKDVAPSKEEKTETTDK